MVLTMVKINDAEMSIKHIPSDFATVSCDNRQSDAYCEDQASKGRCTDAELANMCPKSCKKCNMDSPDTEDTGSEDSGGSQGDWEREDFIPEGEVEFVEYINPLFLTL